MTGAVATREKLDIYQLVSGVTNQFIPRIANKREVKTCTPYGVIAMYDSH